MGKLMDDPLGVPERLDEFLGTSIYSYEDLTAILRSLFNTEEREMIRQAGMREWERQNPQSTPEDQKWPSQDPRWNAQTEEGRRNMIDMRNIIIQGIREVVPRGQNLSKQKAEKWLTDARLLKYEAILIHAPELELRTTKANNPAEFLFGEVSGGPTHNCSDLIELQTNVRADLEDEELEEEEKWFVDSSARVIEGKRKSGYAIINGKTGEVDFTELPKIGRHKYLLVVVDQLTCWVKAFPSPWAAPQAVVKKLLEEIIPRYGIPDYIDSDQGTHFTSKIIKHLADALGIRCEYHTPWHLQSSGQVERMNQTLKTQISKLMLETKMSWVKCLPLALLNIRTQPHSGSGLMEYGMPYEHGMLVGHPRVEDCQIQSYLVSINKNLQELRKRGLVAQSTPLGFAIHTIQPGDKVLIKAWKETPLTPHWERPFLVLLTTDTAVRTAEKGWTHSSQVKRIEPQGNSPQWKVTSTPRDLKLRIHRQTQ
ncbi:hypothetical protein DUI87_03522 [Hirundo rustica rustica]|uniref:Integrase catalytic domain-containing protein n=1 Tax=Hirundo rustica rustica TaxID=333673 RepID=A0A3M0L4U3_HIRRU|nr:hypothetical protein DUI87_03522 [Hirundo rustica rustica]